jgi:hypothetical protein
MQADDFQPLLEKELPVFAIFALTPLTLADGQMVPPNVPNAHYQPVINFRADKQTEWFSTEDSANIARIHVKLPEGAVALKTMSDEMCPQGVNSQSFEVKFPSSLIIPIKEFV